MDCPCFLKPKSYCIISYLFSCTQYVFSLCVHKSTWLLILPGTECGLSLPHLACVLATQSPLDKHSGGFQLFTITNRASRIPASCPGSWTSFCTELPGGGGVCIYRWRRRCQLLPQMSLLWGASHLSLAAPLRQSLPR